ncbi:MAG: hypothetical protein R2839_13065 [Thermomicrobiales bacterium]
MATVQTAQRTARFDHGGVSQARVSAESRVRESSSGCWPGGGNRRLTGSWRPIPSASPDAFCLSPHRSGAAHHDRNWPLVGGMILMSMAALFFRTISTFAPMCEANGGTGSIDSLLIAASATSSLGGS